ncbi:GNAT family N-acetyltransferase [Candidatus Woesearchaeota archaeon]|nr:GNAT family N-acetyltransferase [Candidatus Woesearchaeota archaeon]
MIREFRNEDALRCSEIEHTCVDSLDLTFTAKKYLKSRSTPMHLRQRAKGMHMLVYEIDGEVVGFGALDKREIRGMFTAPEHQDKGIGTAILEKLEEHALEHGCEDVFVHSSPDAEGFYVKHGYTAVEPEYLNKGGVIIESVLMEKLL